MRSSAITFRNKDNLTTYEEYGIRRWIRVCEDETSAVSYFRIPGISLDEATFSGKSGRISQQTLQKASGSTRLMKEISLVPQ